MGESKENTVVGENEAGVKIEVIEVPEELREVSEYEIIELERKFKRRLDLRLLPISTFMYILNYLDRTAIGTARLGSLEKDLNLSSIQYQVTVFILFVGYILMQIPSNMVINKISRPSIYLTCCMLVWATISTCTAATFSFGGMIAARFFLGCAETAFFPGCVYLFSSWYTKDELTLRTTILFSGSFISGAFGGLLGAAIIDHMDGLAGIESWRWLFIVEGLVSVCTVPAAFYLLPDYPVNTKWIDEKERAIALWRIRRDVGKDDWINPEEQSAKTGIKLAVRDSKVWLCSLGLSFVVAAGSGVVNFFPSVVASLNYSNTMTLLLTVPPYMLSAIVTYLNAYYSDKKGQMFWYVLIALFVTFVAYVLACATLNTGARYFAMMLMIPAGNCAYTMILAWLPKLVPRPASKRAIAVSIMTTLSNSCTTWNSFLYPRSSAPRYLVAFSANAGFTICAVICVVVLRQLIVKLNKKLDNGQLDYDREFGPSGQGLKNRNAFRFIY